MHMFGRSLSLIKQMERMSFSDVGYYVRLKVVQMFQMMSIAAAMVGVGLAGAAAFWPDTGIDGTLGGFLAVIGAVALTVLLTMVWTEKFPMKVRRFLDWCAGLVAILTGLAAWFLMQDALLLAMAVAFSALLISVTTAPRKTIQ